MAFDFSREGTFDEFAVAEKLAEAPEVIEMPVILWHVARCIGAEDFDRGDEDFGGAGVG
mgnify:CR=1 FL=1